MIYRDILQTIGNTPLVRLNRITANIHASIYVKIESKNPGFSIKDRIANAMIEAAEKENLLNPGSLIIEPTSGNTGIGLAMVAAVKGYRIILTMPDSMSKERRTLLRGLGAKIILTPAKLGMDGAVRKAEQLVKENQGSFMPQQFRNKANPWIHYRTTAQEIWNDTGDRITHFVAGVGTGGTISGIGRSLKERNRSIRVIAVEPDTSAVLSGCSAGKHGIQGIGAGFVPDNLDRNVIDEVIRVTSEDAISTTRDLIQKEGILAGISSGANVFAAMKVAADLKKDAMVVTILPDSAERYLSTELFAPYLD